MAIQMAVAAMMDGYYTVIFQGGYRTFRLQTQSDDASFAPGKQIIGFLGRDAEYVNFGFVVDGRVMPWKKFQQGYTIVMDTARFLLQGDHQAAGKMYARRSGNCWRCNRVLTTPESIENGIGPVCAGRM